MRPPRLLWQLFPATALLILASLLALNWFSGRSLRGFMLEREAGNLAAMARTAAGQLQQDRLDSGAAAIDSLCRALGESSGFRVTYILPDGKVVGDSHQFTDRMDNHAGRPEISVALAGGEGVATRFSATLQENLMYAAVPVRRGGRILGVLRVAAAVTDVDRELSVLKGRIALGALAVALIAAALTLFLSRRISRPLEDLRRGVRRFSEGDLAARISLRGSREIVHLAGAMNDMAAHLDDRIRKVSDQRNEMAAVLASMAEVLLAVDSEEMVLRMNAAAGRLLGCDPAGAAGRPLPEVTRNSSLLRFVGRALAAEGRVEEDFTVVRDESEVEVQAVGTPLQAADGGRLGAVVVLNDVTRLRRLEQVRRDFVANVSHELKTPVTSIQGFVETLRDGAVEDPEAAARFLEIISRQSDRLHAIIEDLLCLSRLEQDGGESVLEMATAPLASTVSAAVRACAEAAREKDVTLAQVCPDGLITAHDSRLVVQALVNLIDNAIRYNEPGTLVEVVAERTGEGVAVTVRDDGRGIAARHLPRLCERFYRVDKARSRDEGGTGLGLAIVKHIMQAHRGEVRVASEPGVGSSFTLVFPAAD